MRLFLAILVAILTLTTAVTIGTRLSLEIINLMIGIILGVLATIPAVFLVLAMERRVGRAGDIPSGYGVPPSHPNPYKSSAQRESYPHVPPSAHPPVVILTTEGQRGTMLAYPPAYPSVPGAERAPRPFEVVGDGD
jgi:hypothetical protein